MYILDTYVHTCGIQTAGSLEDAPTTRVGNLGVAVPVGRGRVRCSRPRQASLSPIRLRSVVPSLHGSPLPFWHCKHALLMYLPVTLLHRPRDGASRTPTGWRVHGAKRTAGVQISPPIQCWTEQRGHRRVHLPHAFIGRHRWALQWNVLTRCVVGTIHGSPL